MPRCVTIIWYKVCYNNRHWSIYHFWNFSSPFRAGKKPQNIEWNIENSRRCEGIKERECAVMKEREKSYSCHGRFEAGLSQNIQTFQKIQHIPSHTHTLSCDYVTKETETRQTNTYKTKYDNTGLGTMFPKLQLWLSLSYVFIYYLYPC